MEDMIARIFDKNGVKYRREVYSHEWAAITNVLGDDEKRFDFVIEKPTMMPYSGSPIRLKGPSPPKFSS